jgi:transposase InsO family protein
MPLDFVTGLPSSQGCDAVFTVVDRFTKMVVLIPTPIDCDAIECARLLFHVFSMRGVPADLVSLRDTRFTSHYWEQLCERLQIHRSMSSAWHPQSNGSIEIVGIDTCTNVYLTDVIVSPSNGILCSLPWVSISFSSLSGLILITCYF